MGLDIYHYVPAAEGVDFLTMADIAVNPFFLDRYKHLIKDINYGDEIVRGLYIAEKGYQRKQMDLKFYEVFENDKLYFDLASVIKAGKYLEPWPGVPLTEIRQTFKKDFIDNFIEGESIFVAGW